MAAKQKKNARVRWRHTESKNVLISKSLQKTSPLLKQLQRNVLSFVIDGSCRGGIGKILNVLAFG